MRLRIKFTNEDVVNIDDFIPAGEFNPHNVRPWLFHDHGFTLGVAFASCESDALDELADSGKIDHLEVSEDLGDCEEYCRCGNDGRPFDLESVGIQELPNPKFSFFALWIADGNEIVE